MSAVTIDEVVAGRDVAALSKGHVGMRLHGIPLDVKAAQVLGSPAFTYSLEIVPVPERKHRGFFPFLNRRQVVEYTQPVGAPSGGPLIFSIPADAGEAERYVEEAARERTPIVAIGHLQEGLIPGSKYSFMSPM